jgi:TonB family protein
MPKLVVGASNVLPQAASTVRRLLIALALFLTYSSPVAAINACSVLNPVEIAATLRGPGVLVAFGSKTDQEHFHTCFFARVSQAGSFDESLKHFQSEKPLTLAVSVEDNLGSTGFTLFKAEPDTTDTEVPGIGDRAVHRRAANAERIAVAKGSTFLFLGLNPETAGEKHQQDLFDLAREAIATNFDGLQLHEYKVADRAIADDKASFEGDPKDFASLLFVMQKFGDARTYNAKAGAANPNDTDVLYMQGVLDWVMAYQFRMETKSRLGLTPLQPLPAGPGCTEVRAANREKVDEGIAALRKAIKLRPDFGDAMAYLNLMYRERADYECDDAAARAADLRKADEWVDKTVATREANPSDNSSGHALLLFPLPPGPPNPPGTASSGSAIGVLPRPGVVGGVLGGIISSTPAAVPKSGTSQRVEVSAGVSQGLLVRQVTPDYPPLARQARIQGTVVLGAVIGRDGSIQSLHLVSGHPMLAPSAIDAVKQWKYKPYFLNGETVEVETTINVNFTLAGD